MNVAWEVMEDHIVVEMMVAIEQDACYMTFGVSGADDCTAVIGGDVAIACHNCRLLMSQSPHPKLIMVLLTVAHGSGATFPDMVYPENCATF